MGKKKTKFKTETGVLNQNGNRGSEQGPRQNKKRIRPLDVAKTFIKENTDPSGFVVKYIDDFIGRGVFCTREFEQGQFLMEYSGKLLSADLVTDTDYTYHFVFKGKNFCIDATEVPSKGPLLCRLVNHGDRKMDRNAVMKQVEVDGRPHLCLFSSRKVSQGEEILYDYGVRNLPWQNQEGKDREPKYSNNTPGNKNPTDINALVSTSDCIMKSRGLLAKEKDSMNSLEIEQTEQDTCDSVGSVTESGQDGFMVVTSDTLDKSAGLLAKDSVNSMETDTNDSLGNDARNEVNENMVVTSDTLVKSAGLLAKDSVNSWETDTSGSLGNDARNEVNENMVVTSDTLVKSAGLLAKDSVNSMKTDTSGSLGNDARNEVNENMVVTSDTLVKSAGLLAKDSVNSMETDTSDSLGNDVRNEVNENMVVTSDTLVNSAGLLAKDSVDSIETDTSDSLGNDARNEVNENMVVTSDTSVKSAGLLAKDSVNSMETDTSDSLGNDARNEVNENMVCTDESLVKSTDSLIKENDFVSNLEMELADIDTSDRSGHKADNRQGDNLVVTSDSLVKSADLLANGKGSVDMDTSGSLGNEASNEETANVTISRQSSARKRPRKVFKDPYTDMDEDMVLSDDSFDDPSYTPTKQTNYASDWSLASDEETESQVRISKPLMTKRPTSNPVIPEIDPAHVDILAANSDSDDSLASETYPALSKLSRKKNKKATTNLIPDSQTGPSETTENQESFGVTIETTTAYVDGRRNVDKRHCCVFCGMYVYRLPRHYQRYHRHHPRVAALKEKSGKDRNKDLDRFRLEGAYKHNIKVLTENKGSLILPRRPNTEDELRYSYEDYLHCEYCLGFFLKHNLWRHQKNCQFKTEDNPKGTKRRPQRNAVLLLETALQKDKSVKPGYLKNVIATLHVDEISNIVKNDDVIMKVGDFMYDKHAKSQRDYISQEIRLLGRLVKSLRNILEMPTGFLKDFLKPKHFDSLVEAARDLAMKEETEDSIVLKKYSVALKCGPSLNKCCVVLKGIARRNSDNQGEKEAKRLQNLIEDEWSSKVTSVALRSRKEKKRNEVILLPTPADLMKLKTHLDNEIKVAYETLKAQNDNSECYQKLQKAILCRMIMFNRRRSGEASKIRLNDYLMRPDWRQSVNDEIYQSLGALEKQLVQRLDMIALRGKRDRPVTIIVTPEVKAGLELLLRCRPFNIDIDNPYLFARASGENNIRGSEAMRQFANAAALEFPERIGATNMRKYIATVVQMLNLNQGELEWLSNHLGHTIDVHKEYYRNQGAAIQLGKVAKTLIAMDQGQTLSSLQTADLPDDIVTQGLSDDEDEEEEENNTTQNDNGAMAAEHGHESDSVRDDTPEASITDTKARLTTPWSMEEIAAIKRNLQGYINTKTCPGKDPCMEAISKEPVLKDRPWKSVKYKVVYLFSQKKYKANGQEMKKGYGRKKEISLKTNKKLNKVHKQL